MVKNWSQIWFTVINLLVFACWEVCLYVHPYFYRQRSRRHPGLHRWVCLGAECELLSRGRQVGSVRHHGGQESGGWPAGKTALQARPLTEQPPPFPQPSGESWNRNVHAHTSPWMHTGTGPCVSPLQYKADLVGAFSRRVLPYFSDQPASLKPVIDSSFSLEDVAEAHRHMEANRNVGKIIINVIPQNEDSHQLEHKQKCWFKSCKESDCCVCFFVLHQLRIKYNFQH